MQTWRFLDANPSQYFWGRSVSDRWSRLLPPLPENQRDHIAGRSLLCKVWREAVLLPVLGTRLRWKNPAKRRNEQEGKCWEEEHTSLVSKFLRMTATAARLREERTWANWSCEYLQCLNWVLASYNGSFEGGVPATILWDSRDKLWLGNQPIRSIKEKV